MMMAGSSLIPSAACLSWLLWVLFILAFYELVIEHTISEDSARLLVVPRITTGRWLDANYQK